MNRLKVGDRAEHLLSQRIVEIVAYAEHNRTGEKLVVYRREFDGKVKAMSEADFYGGQFEPR